MRGEQTKAEATAHLSGPRSAFQIRSEILPASRANAVAVMVVVAFANGVAPARKRQHNRLPSRNREDVKRSKQPPTVPPERSCKASATESETQKEQPHYGCWAGWKFPVPSRPPVPPDAPDLSAPVPTPPSSAPAPKPHGQITDGYWPESAFSPASQPAGKHPRTIHCRLPRLRPTHIAPARAPPTTRPCDGFLCASDFTNSSQDNSRTSPVSCRHHRDSVAHSRRWHPCGFPHGGRSGPGALSTTFRAVALLMPTARVRGVGGKKRAAASSLQSHAPERALHPSAAAQAAAQM